MNLEQNNKGASGVALNYLLAAAQAHIGQIETSHQSLLENTVGALRLDSRLCEVGDIFVAFGEWCVELNIMCARAEVHAEVEDGVRKFGVAELWDVFVDMSL